MNVRGRGAAARAAHRIEAIEHQPLWPPGRAEHHVEIVVAKAIPKNAFRTARPA